MKMSLKREKGITLIALIVKIIILLILAGVAISSLSESGLFEKAKIAKQKQTETEVKEKNNLLVSEYAIEREQGKTLLQFLTEKKDSGEIDDFVDNNDGTFDVIINGYTTTINESDLSTTEPQILSDIMVTCLAKEFTDNKIQALITVKSQSGGIKKIRLINNVTVQGNNKSSITFDQAIEANTEYQVEVELTNGTTSTKTIKYEDTEAPTATIELSKKVFFKAGSITANINIKDNRSGVNVEACKWVAVQNSENLGTTDESLYAGGTFSSTTQIIEKGNLTETGEYYIHLLLKDNVGNVVEVISEKIEIKEGYEISTPEELQAMGTDLAGHYYVTKDIDMTGFKFKTISGKFSGTLDGQGNTISNLTITSSDSYAGVFKYASGTIENILFKNLNVTSTNSRVGGLIGNTDGDITIRKVGIEGNITGSSYVGGFIGSNNNVIHSVKFENCYARTNIGSGNSYDAGGFIGYQLGNTNAIVKNSYFSGIIDATKRTGTFRGGIGISNNNNQITNFITVTDSFYNKDLFTLSVPKVSSGIGLTTKQFANSSNFTNWDFKEKEDDTEYTWYIGEDGYPELKF